MVKLKLLLVQYRMYNNIFKHFDTRAYVVLFRRYKIRIWPRPLEVYRLVKSVNEINGTTKRIISK